MQTWRVTVAVFVSALIPSGGALADANDVRGLIKERCIACHAVPGFSQEGRSRSLVAPGFAEIANKPDVYPHERLRKFLSRPHFPMRQFSMSDRTIEELIAFIQTLKAEK
jgi:mono/diheme cytochrome c family protein